MKFRELLIGATLSAISVSCFALGSEGQYNFNYGGKLEHFSATPSGSAETVFDLLMATGDGHPSVLAHQDTVGAIEQVKEGNKIITHVVPQVYGYRLVVTPEAQVPGQFEKAGRVNTTITMDQSVKGQDGKPAQYSITKKVSLASGEAVALDWINEGEPYRLTVKFNGGQWNKFN
ncbi:hypothetical protein POF45_22230 [Pseudomonas sp. 681]|uniref:Uncharacterized protein n=1 Tax=Pseudomonas fungipugnans TaxID=3024217 RepID=A0ABT6QT98_9PSED|nr:hypothetical protein [Pseudomonas sp. 681]MDI2594127.1 hypothetical protein [Pseudomonas sp. 681]